jgi:hypothetical protein
LKQLQWKEQGKQEDNVKDGETGVEEDVNVVGVRKRHAMARDHREWKKIVLEATVQHNRL